MNETEYHPHYLRGIGHFNRQHYFESHEIWEDLWIGETGPARLFYKGLIQAAVALHHLTRGNLHGANKLLEGSQRYLEPYRPWHLGLDVDGFLAAMRRCFDGALISRAAPVGALVPKIELCPPPDENVRRALTGRHQELIAPMPSTFALDCWFLTGPTAGRKTEIGLELARRIGAEIISMDSMAVYQGMDIGTAKPTSRERSVVPHHLVDVLEPHEEYSVAEYLSAAQRAVDDIRSRGHEVLFVGGTPLYLKALLRGMFRGPPADWALRRGLEEEADGLGPEALHRRLAEVDPEAARRLHPNDTRRIVRALEVHVKTGRPISAHQQQFAVGLPAESCRVFVLDWCKEELAIRVDRRVEQMFAAGLVDETRRLLAGPQPLSKTARQALGYREVIVYLEGQRGLEETVALVKMHTKQFAKRQRTWFRSLSECRFVPVSEAIAPAAAADQIVSTFAPRKALG